MIGGWECGEKHDNDNDNEYHRNKNTNNSCKTTVINNTTDIYLGEHILDEKEMKKYKTHDHHRSDCCDFSEKLIQMMGKVKLSNDLKPQSFAGEGNACMHAFVNVYAKKHTEEHC
ncbi:unnamed protein product [Onchocerca flexuosa]|uniref:Uncharacterized protein n=1 Tax=Onchocerca flexuosa TaxID=387005 RepID=A0A183H819_9BILA|nr:unnamed protein product [Onchocerca flexuosa]